MTNPNPTYITDAMWNLWLTSEQVIPGVRLGGIYASKSGYHNTVNSNKKSWPGNYSIVLSLDLTDPANKARAIDLTMDNQQMVYRTGLLKASALDPVDDRLSCVREFYGTLDTVNVYGLIKDNEGGPWRFATSDSSHLWHIHISIFTTFVALWNVLRAIASVLSGQTYAQWLAEQGGGDVPLKAIMTNDSTTGDTIFLIPSAGGWRRMKKSDNSWHLQNALDSFYLAGMDVDRTTWASSSYDFTDPWVIAQWGQEIGSSTCTCECECNGGGDGESVTYTITGTITGDFSGVAEPAE